MPPTGGDLLDTSTLDPEALQELLPASGADLSAHGDLILELVVEERDRPPALQAILEVCVPFGAESIAAYAVLPNPIPALSQAVVREDGMTSVGFHAFDVAELALEDRVLRDPCLVTRPVRIFDGDSMLIFVWRAAGGHPRFPAPRSRHDYHLPVREFPGTIVASTDIEDEIRRGVPEHQACFAVEWGGRGPSRFDEALADFDQSGASPQAVLEKWTASIVTDMGAIAAEDLPLVHEQWEVDLQSDLIEAGGDRDQLRSLAMLGTLATIVDNCREDMEGDPGWFTEVDNGSLIEQGLAEIEKSLDRFSARLRDSIALASAISSATALRLQRENQRQSESLQAAITTITSVIAGPALVFGVFGANVPLPLGSSWWGLVLMSVLAVISALAIRWMLVRLVAGARDPQG